MKRFLASTAALAASLYYVEALIDPLMFIPLSGDILWAGLVSYAVSTWARR